MFLNLPKLFYFIVIIHTKKPMTNNVFKINNGLIYETSIDGYIHIQNKVESPIRYLIQQKSNYPLGIMLFLVVQFFIFITLM